MPKISQLPTASFPLAGTELVPLDQGGVTVNTTISDLISSAVTGPSSQVPYFDPSNSLTSDSDFFRTSVASAIGYGLESPLSTGFLTGINPYDSNFGSSLIIGVTSGTYAQVSVHLTPAGDSESFILYGSSAGSHGFLVNTDVQYQSVDGTRFTFPVGDGTNGQVLTTDGSGNLSWAAPGVSGWSGTFSTGDLRTATIVNGIITNVA